MDRVRVVGVSSSRGAALYCVPSGCRAHPARRSLLRLLRRRRLAVDHVLLNLGSFQLLDLPSSPTCWRPTSRRGGEESCSGSGTDRSCSSPPPSRPSRLAAERARGHSSPPPSSASIDVTSCYDSSAIARLRASLFPSPHPTGTHPRTRYERRAAGDCSLTRGDVESSRSAHGRSPLAGAGVPGVRDSGIRELLNRSSCPRSPATFCSSEEASPDISCELGDGYHGGVYFLDGRTFRRDPFMVVTQELMPPQRRYPSTDNGEWPPGVGVAAANRCFRTKLGRPPPASVQGGSSPRTSLGGFCVGCLAASTAVAVRSVGHHLHLGHEVLRASASVRKTADPFRREGPVLHRLCRAVGFSSALCDHHDHGGHETIPVVLFGDRHWVRCTGSDRTFTEFNCLHLRVHVA
uniref:Uncharacterized protein n=1 Tax=Leersia perrieri TaxID=77586 RepID=A0A0D9VFZ3_9ORYZ